MKGNRKNGYKELWFLNCWGFRNWWKQSPAMYASYTAAAVLGAVLPYTGIWFSARIIDELAGARSTGRLFRYVLTLLLVSAAVSFLKAAAERWKQVVQAELVIQETMMYARKDLSMDFSSIDISETHDLRAQIEQNRNWRNLGLKEISDNFDELVTALMQILGALVLTVSLFTRKLPASAGRLTILNHPAFGLGFLAFMLIVLLTSTLLEHRAEAYVTKCAKDARKGNRYFSAFGCLAMEKKYAMDIRLYRQDYFSEKYMKADKSFMPGGKMARYARGSMGFLVAASTAVFYIFIAAVYLFVCMKAYGGAFGVGSVTQYISAVTAMASGVSGLILAIGHLQINVPFLKLCYEYMHIPNEMYQGSLTIEKRSDRNYEIEFKDVSFKYPGSDTWALRHVSLHFRIGERMAVVGENGSGKTTFIKLLCRLYDPDEGEILLNGINIRKYNYQEYLSIFSVVFQDFKLLAFPLGENVAAAAEYDHVRAEKCLRGAGLTERLETLPQGLTTYLYRDFDNSGVEVSGGEAQKIAIARALYKNTSFMVLDEPTAALDPISEAEIYSRFNDLVEDKTAIYISHRLSSCRFCDEILVFDHGNVVQKGSHEQLVKEEGGKYQELWSAQAQYYQ